MNINIAFNTIIYIMVFLFPGILFRRSFFSGKFNKHFDSGNNIERLLWNILFSVICLSLFICINTWTKDKITTIFDITSDEILTNFTLIYQNKFPLILNNFDSLTNVFYALISLYFFSGIIGFFLHKIIFIFGFEKRFSIFKFQNNWDYLTNSNRQNNVNHKLGDIHYTKVDIKTDENELFTGKLHEIIFDKEGKIDAIAIQETYKFYKLNKESEKEKIEEIKLLISDDNPHIIEHFETKDEYIYKKRVKGNIFTVFNDKIQNISITYIKISHFFEKFQKFVKYTISTLILLVTLFSISYGIWDFHLIEFSSTYKRIGFCIITPLSFCFLILFFIEIFSFKRIKQDKMKFLLDLKDAFLILIYFLIPYLYVFDYVTFYTLIYILLTGIIALGLLLSKNDKKTIEQTED